MTDQNWISELGIRYQLGLDGLNLFLVAMTALLWVPSAIWGAVRVNERPRLFMFHLGAGRDGRAREPSAPRTWRCSSSSST
ncbi:MAG: hypothetical protein WKF40_05775 [Thermoleophilaceae bacterium]